jgi:hypothetical protein
VIFVRFMECVKLRERSRAVRAKIAEMYSAYLMPLVTSLQICGAFFKIPWSKVKKADCEATDFRTKSVHPSFKTFFSCEDGGQRRRRLKVEGQ